MFTPDLATADSSAAEPVSPAATPAPAPPSTRPSEPLGSLTLELVESADGWWYLDSRVAGQIVDSRVYRSEDEARKAALKTLFFGGR